MTKRQISRQNKRIAREAAIFDLKNDMEIVRSKIRASSNYRVICNLHRLLTVLDDVRRELQSVQ